MRSLTPLVGLLAMTIIAAPAHAEPGLIDEAEANNPTFLASLQKAGIDYGNPDQAIAAARAVCGLVNNGKSGLEVLRGLMTANPGFSTDGAAQFTAIAASAYCPDQLSTAGATAG